MAIDEFHAKKGAFQHGFHRSFDFDDFACHKGVILSILEERVNQFIVNINAARERWPLDTKSKIRWLDPVV
jgi:hypothetical protein